MRRVFECGAKIQHEQKKLKSGKSPRESGWNADKPLRMKHFRNKQPLISANKTPVEDFHLIAVILILRPAFGVDVDLRFFTAADVTKRHVLDRPANRPPHISTQRI